MATGRCTPSSFSSAPFSASLYISGAALPGFSPLPRSAKVATTRLLTHPLGLTAVAFCHHCNSCFLLTKTIGKHLEEPPHYRRFPADWRDRDVDRRCLNAKSEAAGPAHTASRIHTWKMEAMSLGQAIWIGACQIFSAVFPGTSRSMATIAAGQLAGMSRAAASSFRFSLDTDDGGCDRLRPLEISARKRRRIRSASRRSIPTDGLCSRLDS